MFALKMRRIWGEVHSQKLKAAPGRAIILLPVLAHADDKNLIDDFAQRPDNSCSMIVGADNIANCSSRPQISVTKQD